MNNLEQLIRNYIKVPKVMQLATAVDNQPWACSLHYYSDDDLNIYWCSTEAKRHSKEIEQNPKVAAAIVVHEDTPTRNYVIGMSVEGTAELLGARVDKTAGQAYAEKLNMKQELITDILNGKNPHKFYRLKPSRIVLFDNKTFTDNPRQEFILG